MELDDIVDKYKSSKVVSRALIVFFSALVIPAWIWLEDGEILNQELDQAQLAESSARRKFASARKKTTELPRLMETLNRVENQLDKAKKYLPKEIRVDEILNTLGTFERDLGITVTKFTPGIEQQPNPNIKYKELAIDIELESDFIRTMSLFDKIIHMTKIVHLRNISMVAFNDKDKVGVIKSSAKMVVFRSF